MATKYDKMKQAIDDSILLKGMNLEQESIIDDMLKIVDTTDLPKTKSALFEYGFETAKTIIKLRIESYRKDRI